MIVLRALGNCVIETPKAKLTPHQEVVFAAALFLLLERDKKVTREALEHILWPGLREADRAHHRLRQTLLKLKQSGVPVVREKGFFRIAATSEIDFETILSTAKENALPPLPPSFQLLPDYFPRFSPEYAYWLDEKRREVNSALVRILLEHIRYSRNRAEWARVEELSRTCSEIDPYNEEAVLARAESVALRGGKIEALAVLDRYISELGDDNSEIRIPPTVMRRRISERRLPDSYRTESELIGRGETMAFLTTLLDRTRSGFGQALLVSGTPGIGKSRVLLELGRFAELQGARVERMRCRPTDKDRPLSLFSDLTPMLMQMRGAIGCSEETLARLRLLNTNGGRTQGEVDLETELVYPRIQAALFDLLDAVCEEQTLVVCVDDIQWLDDVSARLLNSLITWCRAHKLLIVMSARQPSPEWLEREVCPSLHCLALENLDPESSITLLTMLVSSASTQPSEAFRLKSVAIADGNPFFLQEIARQWLETGNGTDLPQSLETIVQERISRLSDRAIQTLQTCALLGNYSTIDRIEAVLEFKTHELLANINELSKTSMIVFDSARTGVALGARLTSRHDILSAAALSRLNQPGQAFLHRKIGLVLEREADGESAALLWECAEHWHRAGDNHRALQLALSCARHMVQVGLYAEAGRMFEKALVLTDADDVAFQIAQEKLKAFQLAGEWQAAYEASAQLATWNTKQEAPAAEHNPFELAKFDARWRFTTNWQDLLEELWPCIFSLDVSPSHRLAAGILGLKIAGNLAQGTEFDEIFEGIRSLLYDEGVDRLLRLEAVMIYHTDKGDLDSACAAAEQYVADVKLSDSPLALVGAMRNAAHVFRRAGQLDRVVETLSAAYEIAIQNKLLRRASLIALSFVKSMLEAGDIERAYEWHTKSDESLLTGDLHSLAEHHLHAARLALFRQNLDEAMDLFGNHFALIKTDQSLLRRVSALALLVLIKAARCENPESLIEPLRKLEEGHLLVRGTGGQDFETAALVSGLRYVGESTRASDLLEQYLSRWRRDRGPKSRELSAVLEQI